MMSLQKTLTTAVAVLMIVATAGPSLARGGGSTGSSAQTPLPYTYTPPAYSYTPPSYSYTPPGTVAPPAPAP